MARLAKGVAAGYKIVPIMTFFRLALPLVIAQLLLAQTPPGNKSPNSQEFTVAKLPPISVQRDWVDWLGIVFTGSLVLIGIGGVCAALRTLNSIKEQTRATRDNAQALINSERAWVVVESVTSRPPFVPPEPALFFVFALKNRGRTAARITGPFRREFRTVPLHKQLPETPEYNTLVSNPERVQEDIAHGSVLVPDEQFEKWLVYRTSKEELERIGTGAETLFMYASLVYFDLADTQRELQFCYQYVGDNFYPPPEPYKNWTLAGYASPAYQKHI